MRKRTAEFKKRAGRRPRILIADFSTSGKNRNIKILASALADMGFDVDISPSFQPPEKVAKMAVENDVHIIGLSGAEDGYDTLVASLIGTLDKEGCPDVQIVIQGNIPKTKQALLYRAGVKEILTSEISIAEAMNKIMNGL
jgi:methylmalonyl-CoA mutase